MNMRLMMQNIFLILIFLTTISNVFGQSRTNFTLENITVKAGEKGTGFVEVPKGVDDAAQIPVSIFHAPPVSMGEPPVNLAKIEK